MLLFHIMNVLFKFSFLLIILSWLVHVTEQSDTGLFLNEAKLEGVFQSQPSIQSTAPDQRQYNVKHLETHAALSSAPTRFPVQPVAQGGYAKAAPAVEQTSLGAGQRLPVKGSAPQPRGRCRGSALLAAGSLCHATTASTRAAAPSPSVV